MAMTDQSPMETIQSPQTWTLKVELNGDVRRAREVMLLDESESESLSLLRTAVGRLFDLTSKQLAGLHLRYRDDENELCTLVDVTLLDALRLAGASGTLRLQAEVKVESDTASESLNDTEDAAELPSATGTSVSAGDAQDDLPPASDAQPRRLTERLSAAVHASISEAREATAVRLNRAQQMQVNPKLVEGFGSFVQQIQQDFEMGRGDMREAFAKNNTTEENAVQSVASIASGVFLATRFAPVRIVRLAAKSAAGLVGGGSSPNAPSSQDSDLSAALLQDSDSSNALVREAAESPAAAVADQGTDTTAAATTPTEFGAFKQVVARDFCMARDEIKAAANDIVGPDGAVVGAIPALNRAPRGECHIPAVAGNIAGASVAITLLPLRATTLALAKLNAMRTGGTTEESSIEEPREQVLHTEQIPSSQGS